jgi:hypothetical protein
MRAPEVTGNDPSPVNDTYLTSSSSRASSFAESEAWSFLMRFRLSVARRSSAARSRTWVWSWLRMITPTRSDEVEGGV